MAGGAGGNGMGNFISTMNAQGKGETTSATPISSTPTARAYENLYGLMLAPPTMAYVPQQMRSNYDPARAQRMADMSLAYQKAGATANTEGYNKSMQALQAQRDAAAAKRAADEAAAKKAAEEAALREQMGGALGFGFASLRAAQGGLASLQGFIR